MSKSKIILTIAILFCVTFSLFSFVPVLAGSTVGDVHLINPLGGTETSTVGNVDLDILLGEIVARILMILGSITLLVFVIGGFLWLTSAGNAEKIKLGTNTMLYAVIGLFVIFSSYAILNMIISNITNSPINSGSTQNTSSKVEEVTTTVKGSCRYVPLDEKVEETPCEDVNSKEDCTVQSTAVVIFSTKTCQERRDEGSCIYNSSSSCVDNELKKDCEQGKGIFSAKICSIRKDRLGACTYNTTKLCVENVPKNECEENDGIFSDKKCP